MPGFAAGIVGKRLFRLPVERIHVGLDVFRRGVHLIHLEIGLALLEQGRFVEVFQPMHQPVDRQHGQPRAVEVRQAGQDEFPAGQPLFAAPVAEMQRRLVAVMPIRLG